MKNFWPKVKHYHKRAWIVAGILIGTLTVIFLALLIAAYFLTPQLTRYQDKFVQMLSDSVQQPVTIETFTAEWESLGPLVVVGNVKIWDDAQQNVVASAADIEIHLSLLDFLYKRALILPRLF